jgi:glycosyltransferase involved in cell wall biosynthesis
MLREHGVRLVHAQSAAVATGWLVPPDDPAELAGALDLALDMDEDARRRLADRARAFVSDEFGMAASCERILAIYRELSADLHRPYAGPPPLKGAA